jgi:hypothetical protein
LFGGGLALEFEEERAPSTPARALADSSRGEHAAGFLSSALSSRSRFPILVWASILLLLVNHDIIVTVIVISGERYGTIKYNARTFQIPKNCDTLKDISLFYFTLNLNKILLYN